MTLKQNKIEILNDNPETKCYQILSKISSNRTVREMVCRKGLQCYQLPLSLAISCSKNTDLVSPEESLHPPWACVD